MTYVQHVRVTASGTLGNGSVPVEIFSYGFSLGIVGGPGTIGMPDDGEREDITAAVVAFHGRPATKINGGAKLKSVKFALIGPDGHYVEAPREEFVSQNGGDTSNGPPAAQVSCCVTLEGPPAVRTVTGRFYLPLPTPEVDPASLTWPTTVRDSILGSASTLLSGVNTALEAIPLRTVVIASQGRNLGVIPPENVLVKRVRVGCVPDTQRRRRDALLENYAALDV